MGVRSRTTRILGILLFTLFIFPFVFSSVGSNTNSYLDPLTRSVGDRIYCLVNGVCNTTVVGNITINNDLDMMGFNIDNIDNVYATTLHGTLNWSELNGYPNQCGTGEAVQVIGDTLTCIDLSAYNDTGINTQRVGGSPFLYNDSTTIYLNQTYLDLYIDLDTIIRDINTTWVIQNQAYWNGTDVNFNIIQANDWSNVTISSSQITDLSSIDTDTQKAGSAPHLYNDSTYIYLNGTYQNQTINALIQQSTFNASQLEDIWVNETGDTMTGNLNMTGNNITEVFSLGFQNNGSYFTLFDNGTKVTLQLWVNGQLQQDWGASTTIYREATFLDSIFGDGSTLLNVCLPTGLTVQGQPCNATSIFVVDEIWINEINGNATFNESKLNQTVNQLINQNGFDGFFTSLNFTGTTGFDDFVDNNTDYCKDGVCGPLNITGPVIINGTLFIDEINVTALYASNIDVINLTAEQINAINIVAGTINVTNMTVETLTASVLFAEDFYVNGSVTGLCQTNGTGCPNQTIDTTLTLVGPYLSDNGTHGFFDEAYLNSTIQNLAEVKQYEEYINFTSSGGVFSGQSSMALDFLITRITVTPSSLTTQYRFEAVKDSNGDIIDKDRKKHKGVWDIEKSIAIDNDFVNISLTQINPDDTFSVKITYIDNFYP